MPNSTTCSFDGCERPMRARGLCSPHHKQHKMGKPLKALRIRKRDCVSPEDHFWSRVDKSSGCWVWTGPLTPAGYGQLRVDKTLYMAHRYSMLLKHGQLTEGLVVDHMCFNRACVNPAHLREVNLTGNGQNRGTFSGSTGRRNVFPSHSKLNPYRVQLYVANRAVHIGVFATLDEADSAAIAARREHYPYSQW